MHTLDRLAVGVRIREQREKLFMSKKDLCLVYNKNTQNCRGDSPKLQREIPQ